MMNEAETRAELIDPAIKGAGWGVVEGSRVRREVITLGRLQADRLMRMFGIVFLHVIRVTRMKRLGK